MNALPAALPPHLPADSAQGSGTSVDRGSGSKKEQCWRCLLGDTSAKCKDCPPDLWSW